MGDIGRRAMEVFQSCRDISDIKPFYLPKNLFLKPVATLNISVQFPSLRLSGHSISSKVLMDKLRSLAAPDTFCSLRVLQSTVEFIRFEAEIENRSKLQNVLNRLDGGSVTLSKYLGELKVRASPAKPDFPSRHDWDSFFREAKHMNEMKAGERPDTLHIKDLPRKWFSSKGNPDKPSESVLWKAFEQFGEIQTLDIPSIDPYRSKMKAHISGLNTFSFNQNFVFDAFIQFKTYFSFVNAMDTLRGMKLLRKESKGTYATNIKVDFDRTKHLSENSIRKRDIQRQKIISGIQLIEDKEFRLKENSGLVPKEISIHPNTEEQSNEKHQEKEGSRKENIFKKTQEEDISRFREKIAAEEKLLLEAQRKLESIRLLSELLKRIKVIKEKSNDGDKLAEVNYGQRKKIKSVACTTQKIQENEEVKKEAYDEDSIISDSSVGSYQDYKEPLRVNRTGWQGREPFRKFKWREKSFGRRWPHFQRGNRGRGYFRERDHFYSRHYGVIQDSYGPSESLCDITQQMYYRYFKSISKKSVKPESSQSHSRRPDSNNCRISALESNISKPSSHRKESSHHVGVYNNKVISHSQYEHKRDKQIVSTSYAKHNKKEMQRCEVKRSLKKVDSKKSKWSNSPKKLSDGHTFTRCSSIHTWSRSPSRDSEPPWERSCESPLIN